jgi:phosphoglycerate dehydrogenase-like enzyme
VVSRAEQVLGLVLACRKELPLLLRADAWDPEGKQRGRLLHGARVLVVAGTDGSGLADAEALLPLLAPSGADVAWVAGVAAADVATIDVLVLLPGAPRVGADVLAALPEDASVIDACAPGAPAVDLDALAEGLAAGRPRHAALLVAPSAPDAGHALWTSPRVLLVPAAPVADRVA